MKVLILVPGDQARVANIRDSGRDQLFDLQHIVGGYVEQVHTQLLSRKKNVALVDEDGIAKGKVPNRTAELYIGYAGRLFGTVVVLGEERDLEDGSMTWCSIHE